MTTSATRQRFIDSTAHLLQQRGYHGTGLRDVLEHSRAPRGSLYFHFPGGKEQLAAEAIQHGAGRICEALRGVFAATRDIGEAVTQILSLLALQLQASDFTLGCPVAPVALEQVEGALLTDAVRSAYDSWHAVILARLLEEGHAPARAQSLATFALSAIEGALLLSKVRRDVAPMTDTAKELAALVRREPERRTGSAGATARTKGNKR